MHSTVPDDQFDELLILKRLYDFLTYPDFEQKFFDQLASFFGRVSKTAFHVSKGTA